MDPATGLPATLPSQDAVLQTGKYQIPIYNEIPRLSRPLTYENLSKLERIPCATLLIRVERAPTDPKGNSISIATVSENQSKELGMLKLPPKYITGEYNNHYVDLLKNELRIYDEKIIRKDPLVTESLDHLKEIARNDKNFKKKIKKLFKKKAVEELLPDEFISCLFDDVERAPQELIDVNYFSQYIPEIGFRFSLDLIFHCDPYQIYAAVCSINPPGSLYQEEPGYEKVIVFNEIDFDSNVKGQKFTETFYSFVNVPSNEKVHMIVDLKAIKFKKTGEVEIKDYAWTIYPVFQHLEVDDNVLTKELYVRSGLHMMPLFQGKVRSDLVKELVRVDN